MLPSLLRRPRAVTLMRSHAAGVSSVSREGKKGALGQADKLAARTSHVREALRLVQACATRGFDEGVSVDVLLNVDAKRTEERVRGRVLLPHGQGKSVRVAVFARGEKADQARAAGAEDLVEEVLKGRFDFERVLATPDTLAALAKVARVLGPKGLMPNPKRGTVVTDVVEAIQRTKAGEVEFRAQLAGIVMVGVGKVSFSTSKLSDNLLAALDSVLASRPDRFRGKPPKRITISSAMGPGVDLNHTLW
jgi:large subunit ribosomal protein L1